MLDLKAQVWYGDTTRENAEQIIFSSWKETTEKDETNESRMANASPREEECFRTRVMFETSGGEGASLIEACMIKEDKECEAHMIKEVATKNDIKEVAMDNMAKVIDQRRMESSTLVLETWAVASEN